MTQRNMRAIDGCVPIVDAQRHAIGSQEGFHHLLITNRDRTLVGVVSSLDFVRWLAGQESVERE